MRDGVKNGCSLCFPLPLPLTTNNLPCAAEPEVYFIQSFHMILGQLPLRAKPSHVEAEPGGSRGTVVIVRTRVGFGVSLVGGGARV